MTSKYLNQPDATKISSLIGLYTLYNMGPSNHQLNPKSVTYHVTFLFYSTSLMN